MMLTTGCVFEIPRRHRLIEVEQCKQDLLHILCLINTYVSM